MHSIDANPDLASNLDACLSLSTTLAVSPTSPPLNLQRPSSPQFRHCSVSNRFKTEHGEISVRSATLRPSDVSSASNTISILLIAQWWAYSLEILVAWVEAGQGLCLLEWTFPGFPSTVFTTRHSLVAEEPYGVRFDGGLDWAKTTREHFGRLQADSTSAHLPQRQCPAIALVRGLVQPSPPRFLNPCRESTGAPRQRSWARRGDQTPIQSPTYDFPPTPLHRYSQDSFWLVPHRQSLATRSFPCSFPAEGSFSAEGSDDGTPQPDSPGPLTHSLPSASTSRSPTPSAGDVPRASRSPTPSAEDFPSCYEDRTNQGVQNQVMIEYLGHRRREAEDLYLRTGDPSGLLAVSRAAIEAGDGVWRPSGLPYF
jgi:hypothetical protein